MRKIIIILIITLTTFIGENIYTNNKELKQNEYVENDVEIVEKTPENISITPEVNEIITEEIETEESIDNSEIKEEQVGIEKNQIISTPKEKKNLKFKKQSLNL